MPIVPSQKWALASLVAPELGRAPQTRQQPVDHPERHKAVPAERPGVDVPDDPVGVVRQGVDGLLTDSIGPFEGGHPM